MERYIKIKELSQGGQGSTTVASDTQTGTSIVIKTVYCDSIRSGNDALQEAKVLQSYKHPNIVEYIDVFLHQVGESECV
jgi:serine/threonine protein kinase